MHGKGRDRARQREPAQPCPERTRFGPVGRACQGKGQHRIDRRAIEHPPGQQARHRQRAPGLPRLRDVGDRCRDDSADSQRNPQRDVASKRRGLRFVQQKQRNARQRDHRAQSEAARHGLREHHSSERCIGDDLQAEDSCDDARSEMQFGAIDEIQIEAELHQSQSEREQVAARTDMQRAPHRQSDKEHGRRGDGETTGDRPGGIEVAADLPGDDEPGRAPDQRNQQKRNDDARAQKRMRRGCVAHSAEIALASAETSLALLSHAVTMRMPSPQS